MEWTDADSEFSDLTEALFWALHEIPGHIGQALPTSGAITTPWLLVDLRVHPAAVLPTQLPKKDVEDSRLESQALPL